MIRLVVAIALLLPSLRADADPSADRRNARAHYRQGEAYQAAGAYDQAIEEFRAAYALTPLPPLLFNLGQALRLKGDKRAALDHYRRFLEAQPEGRGSDEARAHVAQLATIIADEDQDTLRNTRDDTPPTPPPPTTAAPPVVEIAAPAPAPAPPPPAPRVPLYKRWWLWTAVGGVAVVGLAVGLGVGLTRPARYPSSPDVTDGTVRW